MPEILIIKPSSLGDIIHGLLVAESIKRQMPGGRITWVVASAFVPLVEACKAVDEVLVFQRNGGLGAFRRLLAELHRRRFDWVLDMQGLARSGLMTRAARCPAAQKLGRSDAREFSGLAYGRRAPLPADSQAHLSLPPEVHAVHGRVAPGGGQAAARVHAVDILREFLPLLGLSRELDGILSFETQAASGAVKAAAQTLSDAEGRFAPIVLFPSSRRAEKEWQGFADLTRHLVAETPHSVIWADGKRLSAPDLDPQRFLNLSGHTNLVDLVPLLHAASVVVCNDSGPMHLAAALHRPVVACFGPTDPACYGPYPLHSPRHRVLVAPHGDLSQLVPERVVEGIAELLEPI